MKFNAFYQVTIRFGLKRRNVWVDEFTVGCVTDAGEDPSVSSDCVATTSSSDSFFLREPLKL